MNPLPLRGAEGVGRMQGVGQHLPAPQQTQGAGFKKVFDRYLSEVNSLQEQADVAVRDLATGKTDNLHDVVVAVNEADLSFRLMMQMRNRLVEAYREIMRMQV